MEPDNELLRRFAENGDQAAFGELVRRYIDLAYSAAVRVLGGASLLAPDVVQSAFTEMARKAGALTRHATLVGWLHTSVRLSALDAQRRERRRAAREQKAALMNDNANSTAGQWELLRPILDEALGRLHDRDRDAILLRFFQNKSHREVGRVLGIGEDAARKRIDRALERLRLIYARGGFVISSALLSSAMSTNSIQAAPVGLAAIIDAAAIPAGSSGGATLALSLLKQMSINKIVTTVGAALALAVAANQWHDNNLLGAELKSLARLSAAARPYEMPGAPPPPTTTEGLTAAKAPKEPVLSLPLDPRLKPGLVPVGLLENRGNATPTAAFETVQWALAHHDMETLKQLLGSTDGEANFIAEAAGFTREEAAAAHEMNSGAFSDSIGMEVDTQTLLDGNRIYLSGRVQKANGSMQNFDVILGRTPSGWKWYSGAGAVAIKAALAPATN